MSLLDARVDALRKAPGGAFAQRFIAQTRFARALSIAQGDALDQPINDAVAYAEGAVQRDGSLTNAAAQEAEKRLLPLADKAKAVQVLLVGHAHIDMNWMWRYDETVAITLETFRTVMKLMDEVPQFTFSQSQASVYRIVEEHDPALLEQIKRRVKEGRWEVSASTWVEADRNMPSTESVARHLLYTKRYLSQLLDLDAAKLNLDYEPDTFGHGAYIPDMLQSGGISYYYHCRGDQGALLYRWQAPSGKEVLCYREPWWYLGGIDDEVALRAPAVCKETGLSTMMCVYGVGDHGGGPTRRDLHQALEMMAWPVYPTIRFGTYAEYFALAETLRGSLPVVQSELNAVFTGCYTTQTRIKKANRVGEQALYGAELWSALAAAQTGHPYRSAAFEGAWRRLLFSQFHDIVTGSCVPDTREYAMGNFQETMAVAATQKTMAMRALAAQIDTSALAPLTPEPDRALGGGVGYGVEAFGLSRTETGSGLTRIFHLFNALPFPRHEVLPLTVWDWPGDPERLQVSDASGKPVTHQFIEKKRHNYWQHDYTELYIEADLPAGGYATYTLTQTPELAAPSFMRRDPRVHTAPSFVLENDRLCAQFDVETGAIASLVDKKTGADLAGGIGSPLRVVEENTSLGMTAWVVGRYEKVTAVDSGWRIERAAEGPLYNSVRMSASRGRSSFTLTYSVRKGCPLLHLDIDADWHERGTRDTVIPQLQFAYPLPCTAAEALFDAAGGIVTRPAQKLDLPAQTFAAVRLPQGGALALFADAKHGFRLDEGLLSCTLVRSSYDPDPSPEYGMHHIHLALGPVSDKPADLMRSAQRNIVPIDTISGTAHAGSKPLDASLVAFVEGEATITCVKQAEDGRGLIVRGHDAGAGKPVRLRFGAPVAAAERCNILEASVAGSAAADGCDVTLAPDAASVFCVRVIL